MAEHHRYLDVALERLGVEPWRFALSLGASATAGSRWCEQEIPARWLPLVQLMLPGVEQTVPPARRPVYLREHLVHYDIQCAELARLLKVKTRVVDAWVQGEHVPDSRHREALNQLFGNIWDPPEPGAPPTERLRWAFPSKFGA